MRYTDARAMAMNMKRLIGGILLIVRVCMLMPLSTADPHITFHWEYCQKSEYTNVSTFQSNLKHALKSLVGNVSTSGFYNYSVDEGQNSQGSVYGLAQCRGDLNSSDCKQCVSNASSTIISSTPDRPEGCNRTSAAILLDGCFLRYDNQSFYNSYSESAENKVICNHVKSNQTTFADAIQDILIKVVGNARDSPELFASYSETAPYNSSDYIYSLAQCWRDLSPKNCEACLEFALSRINSICTEEALGSQFGSVNCYLRSEIYPFFNPSNPSPSPLPLSPPSPPPPVSEAKRSLVKVHHITLGVAAATIGLIAVISLFKWIFFSRRKHRKQLYRTRADGGVISLSASIANRELIFRYDTLREATSNFNAEKKLGEGGFGSVFKGDLPDGREVAVKRLKIGSSQGDSEFLNEVNLVSRVQHRNLVKLLGCSVENTERLLVYEYLHNSSLDNIIFDVTKRQLLDWKQRHEIIVGTARGLAYLHEESEIRIIHRDIKASNILLDNKNRPKITDFGLAKLFDEDKTHVTTRVAGTFGYMAPEYAYRGHLTEKADVFSFGVLLLEIISGKKNQSLAQDTEFLIVRIWKLYNAERCLEVMDPTLEGSYSWEEGIKVIKIGLLCTQAAAALRPSMSRVVAMLTSEREQLPSPTRPAFIDLDNVSAAAPHKTPCDIQSAAADPSSGALEPR